MKHKKTNSVANNLGNKNIKTKTIDVAMLLELNGKDKKLNISALRGAKLALKKINNKNINLIEVDTSQNQEINLSKDTIAIGGLTEQSTANILEQVKDNLFLYLSDGEVFTLSLIHI